MIDNNDNWYDCVWLKVGTSFIATLVSARAKGTEQHCAIFGSPWNQNIEKWSLLFNGKKAHFSICYLQALHGGVKWIWEKKEFSGKVLEEGDKGQFLNFQVDCLALLLVSDSWKLWIFSSSGHHHCCGFFFFSTFPLHNLRRCFLMMMCLGCPAVRPNVTFVRLLWIYKRLPCCLSLSQDITFSPWFWCASRTASTP